MKQQLSSEYENLNKADRTIHVPSLRRSGISKHLVVYDNQICLTFNKDKKIGDVTISCNNENDVGQYCMRTEARRVGDETVESSEELFVSTEFSGTIVECCDKTITSLSNYLVNLKKMSKDIEETIDFLSSTMLGNGELINDSENFEKNKKEINELQEVLFKEEL